MYNQPPPPPIPNQQNDRQELPTPYQYDDMIHTYNVIRAGESLALVGIGSSGKSNFAKHIVRPDVTKYYFQQLQIRDRQPHHLLLIMLNAHQLIHLEESALQHSGRVWPGYELMLNRLRMSLRELLDAPPNPHEGSALADAYNKVNKAYRSMFDGTPLRVQSSIRRLEDAIEMTLAAGPQWQIVFIFDELEEFLRVLPVTFFQSLRGLRDDHKRRLLYITTSRHSPAELLQEVEDRRERLVLEGFTELFNDFTHYLRPLDDLSTNYNMERFAQRFRKAISAVQKEYLRYATGQHMGLMRRGYLLACNTNVIQMTQEQFAEFLLNSEKVSKDCGSIYESLTTLEKASLVHLAFNSPNIPDIPEEIWNQLYNKHLITQDGVIRIPVLAIYVRKKYLQEHS